ncbi:Hypothetical protein D9617_5g068640 [Elsinoe fawcettii]|nr:Hypothetical protein D9617_5g068640 [Elsinoe fawcettii]
MSLASYTNSSLSTAPATIITPVTWWDQGTQTVITPPPYPTYGPATACAVDVSPAVVTWVVATDVPALGTTFLYIDAATNQTSTSVTCTQSLYDEHKTLLLNEFGLAYGGKLDDGCHFVAPIWAPERRNESITYATYPGPAQQVDIGPVIKFTYWKGSDPWVWNWETYLDSTPHIYTGAVEAVSGTGIPFIYSVMYKMPGVTSLLPDLTDLQSCTLFHFETAPNKLTYAPFLTQRITIPKAANGVLTTVAENAPTLLPATIPNPAHAESPTQAAAQRPPPNLAAETLSVRPAPGPTNKPAIVVPAPAGQSAQEGQSQPDQTSQPGEVSQPGTGSQPNNPGDGNVSPPGSPAAATNTPQKPGITPPPALVLPDGQTLSINARPSTVSSRLVFLDNAGTVHIAPIPTGRLLQDAAVAQATAVPLEKIIRDGGVMAQGQWISLRVANSADAAKTEGSNAGQSNIKGDSSSSGQSDISNAVGGSTGLGGSVSAGGHIGQAISELGTWIRSGLGASFGSSQSRGSSESASAGIASGKSGSATTKGEQGTNSTVQPFTGTAASQRIQLSFIFIAATALLAHAI